MITPVAKEKASGPMFIRPSLSLIFLALTLYGCQERSNSLQQKSCAVELIILGTGQDAGAPQIGYRNDRAWSDPSEALTPTALAVADHRNDKRYLFEATPYITQQLQMLDELAPSETKENLGLDGIFITHAHIGHYAGLMFLGREAAGTSDIPVYAMPRMAKYLRTNGPWEQLVSIGNIILTPLTHWEPVTLSPSLQIIPHLVPHRDEYSETVGFEIKGTDASVLFVPDIDSWDRWESEHTIKLTDIIDRVDIAFVDATFYDDHELPNRDMSKIPHPRVTDTMNRLQHLPAEKRRHINFIHYNHTNPIRFSTSPEHREVLKRGFNIARPGQTVCLTKN